MFLQLTLIRLVHDSPLPARNNARTAGFRGGAAHSGAGGTPSGHMVYSNEQKIAGPEVHYEHRSRGWVSDLQVRSESVPHWPREPRFPLSAVTPNASREAANASLIETTALANHHTLARPHRVPFLAEVAAEVHGGIPSFVTDETPYEAPVREALDSVLY